MRACKCNVCGKYEVVEGNYSWSSPKGWATLEYKTNDTTCSLHLCPKCATQRGMVVPSFNQSTGEELLNLLRSVALDAVREVRAVQAEREAASERIRVTAADIAAATAPDEMTQDADDDISSEDVARYLEG